MINIDHHIISNAQSRIMNDIHDFEHYTGIEDVSLILKKLL